MSQTYHCSTTSQCESRKTSISAVDARAPASLARMRPARSGSRTNFTLLGNRVRK